MIFEWQGRLYRLFDSLVFVPADEENAARLTCWASEIGGELEEVEIEGEAAEDVACQLGFTERAA